jgi:exodeoxyribonuclease-5
MKATDLEIAVQHAVEKGVAKFSEKLDVPMPANFLRLEKARLQKLLDVWLAFEKMRAPFTVLERELTVTEDIVGINVKVTLDRVDELPDGRLIVIDYKTGNAIDYKSWTECRITEPQLPMYAAIVLTGQTIAAVSFAKVRIDEQRFIGISAEDDILPGVKSLEANRKLFAADLFPNWASVITHWRQRIEAIAEEIKNGKAAVQFEDEQDLYYCDVKPLLRLPERSLQIERLAMKASGE